MAPTALSKRPRETEACEAASRPELARAAGVLRLSKGAIAGRAQRFGAGAAHGGLTGLSRLSFHTVPVFRLAHFDQAIVA